MIKVNDPQYVIPSIFVLIMGVGMTFFITNTCYDWIVRQTVEMNFYGYFLLFWGFIFSAFILYYGINLLKMSEIQILSSD